MTIEKNLERIADGIEAIVKRMDLLAATLEQPIQFVDVNEEKLVAVTKDTVEVTDKLEEPFERTREEKKEEFEKLTLKQKENEEKLQRLGKEEENKADFILEASLASGLKHELVPPPPPLPVKKTEKLPITVVTSVDPLTSEQLNELLMVELERIGEEKSTMIVNILRKHGAPNITDLDPLKYGLVIEEVSKIPSQSNE